MQSALNIARRAVLNLGLCACLATLASCGGGPVTDESTDELSISALTYSPSAPVSGDPVSATATVTHSDSIVASDISYVWTQTSGPSVSLTGTTSSTVYFTAPTVTSATEIVLKLVVTANDTSSAKSVTITVGP